MQWTIYSGLVDVGVHKILATPGPFRGVGPDDEDDNVLGTVYGSLIHGNCQASMLLFCGNG